MGLKGRTALIAVGAGINLSTYGIGIWGESVLLSSGAFVGADLAALTETYLLFAALGLFGALITRIAMAVRSQASNRRYLATGAIPMAAASVLFLSGTWNTTGPLVALTALCTGWTFACQMLFWMSALSFDPSQMSVAFPLELICAAALNIVFLAGFMEAQALFLGGCIALSGLCSVALDRMDATGKRPPTVPLGGNFESHYLPGLRTFAEVLFCVVALQTIAPTLNYMGLLGLQSPDQQQLTVTAAKVAAALALVAILRFSRAPLYSVQVFKVVTPVLIMLLFAVPFANAAYLSALLIASSCLHFIVTNSLFCIDAVTIARHRRLIFEAFYGVGYLVLMAFCVVLEKVMPQLLAVASTSELLLVFGVFFCVYALSMAFVLVRRRRRVASDRDLRSVGASSTAAADAPGEQSAAAAARGDAPTPIGERATPTDADRVRWLQERCGLSDREAEIVLLVMRGRNVPAIAEELVISQNTVRTHVKRIYRACGVHARQELIELCEAEADPEGFTR